ncbi:hypothetical protein VTN77DRAFT_4496 [Rasamsonia byssochlamydoides]|uniref:uncharacterized protein n=1 Tax=Rasamsonia byssochlamydoides TaxID=89139 RepID=UPI003743F00D
MESMIDWISPLASSALSKFLRLKGPTEKYEVEWVDDQSNIRFRGPTPMPVQIVEWDKEARPTTATLSDSVTAVRAIFSSEFLGDLPRDTKHKFDDVRKKGISCRLELLQFELVLEYIKSQPAIHLFVEAFSFVDKPSLVSSKMEKPRPLDQILHIKDLIDKAIVQAHLNIYIRNYGTSGGLEPGAKSEPGDEFELADEFEPGGESDSEYQPEDESESEDEYEAGDAYDSDESLMSQPVHPVATNNPQAEAANTFQSQEAFATQVPPAQSSPFHPLEQVSTRQNTVVLPVRRTELLRLLESSKPSNAETQQETAAPSPLDSPANRAPGVEPPKTTSPARPPAQSHLHDRVSAPQNTVVPPVRRNELLRLLESSKPSNVETRQDTEASSNTPANGGSSVESPKNISPTRPAPAPRVANDGINYEGTKSSLGTQEPSDHQESQGALDSPHHRTTPSPQREDTAPQDEGNGKKRNISDTLIPAADHESREPSALPEHPRRSGEQPEEGDSQIVERSPKRRKQDHISMVKKSDPSDPWEGMTKISRRDVMIPKDQMELLQSPDCWIPAEPGKITPRCHVPPKLLQKWNEMMSRKRSRSIPDNVSEHSHSANTEPEPALPSVSSSALQPESESEDESEQLSWSSSPSNRDPPKQIVPPDSSPLRRRESVRRPDTLAINNDAAAVEEPTLESQTVPVGEAQDQHSEDEANDSEGRRSIAPLSNGYEAQQDIRSDPSEMEVSVPCALGAVQEDITSQVEDQEITSSGASLLAPTSSEKVQVIETLDERLRSKRMNIDHSSPRGSILHQSSSEVTKPSSQSRIVNSYDSSGRAVEGDQDPFARTQGSLGDKGTQNSGGDRRDHITMSHPETLASAEEFPTNSGFSLDFNMSSQPAASGMSGLSGISSGPDHDLPEPSQLFKQSQSGPQSQTEVQASSVRDGSPQDNSGMEIDVAPATSLKRRADESDQNEQSPPKRPRPAPTSHGDTPGNFSANLMSVTVHHRKNEALSDTNHDKAHEVYDKFRRDYPTYTGDFTHFTRMCSKLQALRNRGLMQRSFLWDDFVIQHLTDYARYLQQCLSAVEEPQKYEDYFCAKFGKPTYKKRSLTVRGIDIAASQCTSRVSVDPVVPSVVRGEATTSFTGSPVKRLSGLQERSPKGAPSNEVPESMHDAPAADDMADDDTDDDEGTHENHETASIELGDEEGVPVNNPGDIDRAASTEVTAKTSRSMEVSSESEGDTSEEESEESGSEAGDERPGRTLADLLLAPPPQPSGPVWSDSPNTPFKIWARADQNLLIERRRRGGAAMPTDEKGVIQPPLYPREGWENGMRTLGWNWKQSRDYS